MNDLELCVEVVSRSCQPLRYIRRWRLGSKGPQIRLYMGYQMVTWPMTSRDPERSNSWSQYT